MKRINFDKIKGIIAPPKSDSERIKLLEIVEGWGHNTEHEVRGLEKAIQWNADNALESLKDNNEQKFREHYGNYWRLRGQKEAHEQHLATFKHYIDNEIQDLGLFTP